MKRTGALLAAALLLLTLLPAAALAEKDVDLNAQNESGRLLITEAGAYTLTGSMKGTVWVDPGKGDVTLILDNISIDGGEGPGIAAVSGDSLTLILADGTQSAVREDGGGAYNGAIFCAVPTRFEGSGRLDVENLGGPGIRGQNADLTFVSGTYLIQGQPDAVETDGKLTVLNASVTDMNKNTALAATPAMVVQTGNSGKLNLRADASTGSACVEQYENGTQVTVLEDRGDWSQVEVNGKTGYMMNQFLTPAQGRTAASVTAEAQAASGNNAILVETKNGAPSQGTGKTRKTSPSGEETQAPDNGSRQQPGAFPAEGDGQAASAESAGEIAVSTAVNGALDLEADMDNASYITVSDENSQVKITDSGTYVVTGSSSDGNITVKKGTAGVVLVLEDLDLTSTSGAAVAVNKEAQVKIIISGSVTLTDAENPEDENSLDAAVADAFDGAAMKFKANSQVFLTGDGTLTINGSAKNGIKAGDESSLVIGGGVTVNISAVNDGINSNYDVTLLDGDFTIAAGDDGIHADHILTIGAQDGHGPTLRITESQEGLEGTVVNVFGGEIAIRSSDNAVNAANADGLYEGELAYSFNMTGGRLTIVSQGDGIDSNGSINLIGGTASISSASMGGEAGVDYDGQYYVADAFQLENLSGVAGPDRMPGAMNAQMMGGPMGEGGQEQAMGRPGMDRDGASLPPFSGDVENGREKPAL